MLAQGDVYRVTCSSSSSPTRSTAPGTTAGQSSPWTVRFSPMAPGTMGCPPARSASIASIAYMHTARSGPPWCSVSRCASPWRPSTDTRADSTAVFGTPPRETLIWTTRPVLMGRRGPRRPRGPLQATPVVAPAKPALDETRATFGLTQDGSQADLLAEALGPGAIVREPGGDKILQRPADRLEHRDLLVARTARAGTRHHLGELGGDVAAVEGALPYWDQDVAGLLQSARIRVDDDPGAAHRRRIGLAVRRSERADEIDVGAGPKVGAEDHRGRRGRRTRDDVRLSGGDSGVGRDLHRDTESFAHRFGETA